MFLNDGSEQLSNNQFLLQNEIGIFAIQNTISTMLRILIPVNNPSVPPKIKEKCFEHRTFFFQRLKKAYQKQQVCLQMSSFYP